MSSAFCITSRILTKKVGHFFFSRRSPCVFAKGIPNRDIQAFVNFGSSGEKYPVELIVTDREIEPTFLVYIYCCIGAAHRARITIRLVFSINIGAWPPSDYIIFAKKICLRMLFIILLLPDPVKAVLKPQKGSWRAPECPLEFFRWSEGCPVRTHINDDAFLFARCGAETAANRLPP